MWMQIVWSCLIGQKWVQPRKKKSPSELPERDNDEAV
jgi:hypothetical protein